MAGQARTLKIFIASPGGLADERRAFKEVIEQVNRDHAMDSGTIFVSVGWEIVSAGMGRPQGKINKEIRESDYLIVVLWDRWGTPPGEGSYTSGTEEEFNVGLQSLKDANLPMRDIVVLFKGVGDRQLADPGEDLRKVLAFKSALEETKELLYTTFDNIDEFRDDFRQHLHQWVRDWQGDGPPPKNSLAEASLTQMASTDSREEGEAEKDGMVRAKTLADRGRFTQAEQLFARAIAGAYDRAAYTEYVRFLRKRGRLIVAKSTAETFLTLAQDADDHEGEIEALVNLAILQRQQGKNQSSLDYLNRAISVCDEHLELLSGAEVRLGQRSAALANKAFVLDNMSLTLRRIPGRNDDALDALEAARKVQSIGDDRRGIGFTLRNRGSLLLRMGRLHEAEIALKESLVVFEEVAYPSGQATALASLGEVYEATGDNERALDMLDRSIAVTPYSTPSRTAMNYAIRARLQIRAGDVNNARENSGHCMRAAKELGTTESMATALHVAGEIAIYDGDYDIARQELSDALELFVQADNLVGQAAVSIDLGEAEIRVGNGALSGRHLERAGVLLERAPHYGLQRDLDRVRALGT